MFAWMLAVALAVSGVIHYTPNQWIAFTILCYLWYLFWK